MFEPPDSEDPHPSVVTLQGWLRELGTLDRGVSDADRVDQLRALEELKNAACAAQAQVSVDLDTSQRAVQAAAGVPGRDQGRGVAAQIGLARRESPHKAARYLGLAKVLLTEMPHTRAGMAAGWMSEWRATLLARETACLSAEHRAVIDKELAGDRADQLQTWGDRRLVAEALRRTYRLDPDAVLARISKAEKDRTVTARPAPDAMAYLTALLPAAKAVACYAALKKAADTARAQGDPRTRGQVMADTLVKLLTGQQTADDTPVEIQLVVTDQSLFANLGNPTDHDSADEDPVDDVTDQDPADHEPVEPAWPAGPADPPRADPRGDPRADPRRPDPREEPGYLHGYGIVPAGWIRTLIATLPAHTQAWLRRVYARPQTGELVAMDSHRRLFKDNQRRVIVTRDQICRTPYCGAPIRHADHPQPHAHGGRTSRVNSQGLCEACNYAKEPPGWTARTVPAPRHTVRTTTPTGHVYDSTAPPLPGHYPDTASPWTVVRPEQDGPPDEHAPAATVPVDPLEGHLDELWAHLTERYAA